jgi:hypothetical protein
MQMIIEPAPVNPDLYPECTRMASHRDHSQAIGDFCEWLMETHNIDIEARAADDIDDILMHYFDIDHDLILQEQDEMLAELHDMNNHTPTTKENNNE